MLLDGAMSHCLALTHLAMFSLVNIAGVVNSGWSDDSELTINLASGFNEWALC